MSEDIHDVLGLASREQVELPSNERMAELGTSVKELIDLRSRIERGEALLKELKQQELRLSNEIIPSKMDELGFSSIKTPEGYQVSYKPFYSAKIIEAKEQEAYDWVENSGHGSVIKGQLVVPYDRHLADAVDELRDRLKEMGWESERKLGIHHSTLRALIRELIEDEGVQPPPDLFDVFAGRKTTIKL